MTVMPGGVEHRELMWTVPWGHPAFEGHFPGQPVLPGVTLLAQVWECVLQMPTWRERLGSAPVLSQAKFLMPVRPGTPLRVMLRWPTSGQVVFEVQCDDAPVSALAGQAAAEHKPRLVASGRWTAGTAPGGIDAG